MYLKELCVCSIIVLFVPVTVATLHPFFKHFINLKNGEMNYESTFSLKSNSIENDGFEVGEQNHGVSHLCIYEHWFKDELIVCDRPQASMFACVGAIEGEIKLCEKSTRNEIFVPVCLQEKTSQMITCKYKKFVSANLCLPRKSLSLMSNSTLQSYRSSTFRVCKSEERFSCFNNGIIKLCNQIKFNSDHSATKSHLQHFSHGHKKSKDRRKSKNKNKLTDEEKYHELLLNFHDTYRSNAHKHQSKTNLKETSKEKQSSNLPTDKNKNNHKTSDRRRYEKIQDNYDTSGRDTNTTDSKHRNFKYNNVSAETNSGSGKGEMKKDDLKLNDMNKYFHMIKCEDCQVDHVIRVENDVYDVKVWTFPSA